jgi:hypothetical protein
VRSSDRYFFQTQVAQDEVKGRPIGLIETQSLWQVVMEDYVDRRYPGGCGLTPDPDLARHVGNQLLGAGLRSFSIIPTMSFARAAQSSNGTIGSPSHKIAPAPDRRSAENC